MFQTTRIMKFIWVIAITDNFLKQLVLFCPLNGAQKQAPEAWGTAPRNPPVSFTFLFDRGCIEIPSLLPVI